MGRIYCPAATIDTNPWRLPTKKKKKKKKNLMSHRPRTGVPLVLMKPEQTNEQALVTMRTTHQPG